MTFEAPQPNFSNEQGEYIPPVAHEVDPNTLQVPELEAAIKAGAIDLGPITRLSGAILEAAFKTGAAQEEELTSKQRLELHNKGYQVTLPEGEVTLH